MTDFERGYAAGIDAAAKAMRSHFGPKNTDHKGTIGWGVIQAIRARAPQPKPTLQWLAGALATDKDAESRMVVALNAHRAKLRGKADR